MPLMKYLLLITVFLVSFRSVAQLENDSLEFRISPDTTRSRELHLSIYNFNFLRNYEFFNDFQDGYTLFGTQLEPRLTYHVNSRLLISAGVHLRKDFGKDGINKTIPLFSIKYQKGKTALINGAIEGNVHHRFIEPVFDFERKINNPVEYGTQFLVKKESLFLDAFINWNKMIERNSPEQEQIFAGLSSDISVYSTQQFKASVPLQVFAFHQGGQIDVNPDPLKTIVNSAIGFKLQWLRSGFVSKLKTENYLVSYKDFSPTKTLMYEGGNAIFLNASAATRFGTLIASYWHGNKYISRVGMPIYQSVSQQINHQGYSEEKRQLLFLRYLYQKQLVQNFYLDFRVEPVIDLKPSGSKSLEFYHSLFLVYKQDFRLFRRK